MGAVPVGSVVLLVIIFLYSASDTEATDGAPVNGTVDVVNVNQASSLFGASPR